MKKVKIVIWVIFFIVAIFIYNFIRTSNFIRDYTKNLKDIKGQLNYKYDDDNFPEFAKDFVFKNSDVLREALNENTLYDSKAYDSVIEEIKKELPENLKDYQTKFAPSILELMKKEKTNKYPTFEETENYPEPPTGKKMRATARFWENLSLFFGREGDYKTSLLVAHGIFYLSREKQTSYAASGELICKMISMIYNKYASKVILVWASHPHPDCQKLSKVVAKDILDFVKTDFPLKRNIEYDKYAIESILKHLSKKSSIIWSSVFNTSYYKEVIELLIDEPLKLETQLESKTFYEVKDEYNKYHKKLRDIVESEKFSKVFPTFCINPQKAMVYFVTTMFCVDLEKERLATEEALGYMEFASIALLINSYYCENNKLPETIEELEKWFGQKLPVNRFDNTPYVIDTKGKHMLTFKHMADNLGVGQLYFDFFK